MKKLLKVLLSVITLALVFSGLYAKDVYAYDVDGILVDIDLNGKDNGGEFKAGEPVTIKVSLKNATDLYASSFNYIYDQNMIQVNSIDVGEQIETSGVYEPYKDTAKNGNKARYCFTFLGDGNGLSGDIDFVTINAQAKADGKIYVGKDNINFELIQRKGDDMVKNDYHFNDSEGNIYKVTNVQDNDNKSTSEGGDNKPSSESTAKKKNDVNIELVQKSEDSNDNEKSISTESSNDSNSEEKENKSNDEDTTENQDNEEKDVEDEEDNTTESKASTEENKEKGEDEVKSGTGYIILVLAAVVILSCGAFYIIKVKK